MGDPPMPRLTERREVPSGNQTNIGFGMIRTSGDISGKNVTLTGATIHGSLANDYLFKVKNTDLTGRGIRSQVGVDTLSALAVI